jgi:DNA damage-binding protein 1
MLQPRGLSLIAHGFNDLCHAVNVVSPQRTTGHIDAQTDFNEVPFSCPAARRILPIPSDPTSSSHLVLVMGDEHSVLYSIGPPSLKSPLKNSLSLSATSPRASAVRRSPQNEVIGGFGKRRKSSMSGKGFGSDNEKWEVTPIWRVRQGFGIVQAWVTPLLIASADAFTALRYSRHIQQVPALS